MATHTHTTEHHKTHVNGAVHNMNSTVRRRGSRSQKVPSVGMPGRTTTKVMRASGKKFTQLIRSMWKESEPNFRKAQSEITTGFQAAITEMRESAERAWAEISEAFTVARDRFMDQSRNGKAV